MVVVTNIAFNERVMVVMLGGGIHSGCGGGHRDELECMVVATVVFMEVNNYDGNDWGSFIKISFSHMN